MSATLTTPPRVTPVDGQRHRRTGRITRRRNWLGGIAGWLWLAVVVIPLYWILITSLKAQSSYYSTNPLVPPGNPTLDNYRLVIDSDFIHYFVNSVVVTAGAVIPAVIVSFMAAYAIVRGWSSRLLRSLNGLFLMGLAIPLSVLVLTNFIRDVPRELFESMRLEGASEWTTLWRLAAPLTRPAVLTVTVYNALTIWNGFLLPLVLTQSPDQRTLPLALWTFQGQYSVNVPAVVASVVLTTLPILVLYAVGRRQLVSGMTAGFSR